MVSWVQIDVSFCKIVVAAVDVSFVIVNGRRNIFTDTKSTFGAIIPNNSAQHTDSLAPTELSQSDLLRLLSYLEGEIQARDIVIATLKSEGVKQLLYQARYGCLSLGDPISALQRDSDLCEECDGLDETEIGHLFESQLNYLERFINVQRRSNQRAKEALAFVEQEHDRIIEELQQDRALRIREVIKRWENKNELVSQMTDLLDYRHMQTEVTRTKDQLENERKRHKTVVLCLLREYEQLRMQLENQENKQRAAVQRSWSNYCNGRCQDNDGEQEQHPPNGIWSTDGHWRHQKGLMQDIVKVDEGTLVNSGPRLPASNSGLVTAQQPGRGSGEPVEPTIDGGPSIEASSASRDSLATVEVASVGADFRSPQQTFHTSGIVRRSSSNVSSVSNRGGVFSTARQYATRLGIGRRQIFSASPTMSRCAHATELSNKEMMRKSQSGSRSEENTSGAPVGRCDGNQQRRRCDWNQQRRMESNGNGGRAEGQTKPPNYRHVLEPEMEELEHVLRILTSGETDCDSTSSVGRTQFPNVDEPQSINSSDNAGNTIGSMLGSDQLRNMSNNSDHRDQVPIRRSNSKSCAIPVGIGTDKARARAAIDQKNGSPSCKVYNRRLSAESMNAKNRSPPPGCSSPYLALQRKAKAISGFATRIQRRVVSGVNQVTVRNKSGTDACKDRVM